MTTKSTLYTAITGTRLVTVEWMDDRGRFGKRPGCTNEEANYLVRNVRANGGTVTAWY